MNHLIVALLVFLLSPVLAHSQAPAASVQWLEYSQALAQSAQDKKPVFVEFHAVWCAPCHVMERTTLKDSTVVNLLNKKFHPVRIDVDQVGQMRCENKWLSIDACINNIWAIEGIPAFATVDSKGFLLHSFVGAYPAEDFQLMLQSLLNKEAP